LSTKVIAQFTKVKGIESINIIKSKGKVSHYNIRAKTKNQDTADTLIDFWPFCNAFLTKNDTKYYVDYVVKPWEMQDFYKNIVKILGANKKNEVAIIIHFSYPVSDQVKTQVKNNLRQNDYVVWDENHVIVILKNCKVKGVKIVQRRVEKILKENQITSISVEVG